MKIADRLVWLTRKFLVTDMDDIRHGFCPDDRKCIHAAHHSAWGTSCLVMQPSWSEEYYALRVYIRHATLFLLFRARVQQLYALRRPCLSLLET
jgi:hypothetical protein